MKSPKAEDQQTSEKPPETWRDTFEQIVLAFVLALVFRTFEAEAFVIPTGSMAPTLYGRNKEMECTQCGHPIVVGASSEVTKDSGLLKEGTRISGAICPNCRYPETEMRDARVFNGDRILVNKFPYAIGEPDYGDVFVFKFPESPETNYIKRLVGLPGQVVRVRGGDLYLVNDDKTAGIRRMADQDKQNLLQILVHDNAYRSKLLDESGWPERWSGRIRDGEGWKAADNQWAMDAESRTFSQSNESEPVWLRYRHVTPTVADWDDIQAGREIEPREQLIVDFCGYNSVWGSGEVDWGQPEYIETGAFWVGDLTVDMTLDISDLQNDAEVVLELCEGQWWYRCRIDAATGKAVLYEIDTVDTKEREVEMATAQTDLSGPGEYELTFANVDDRICLWVDGDLADFGSDARYNHSGPTSLSGRPQWSDLSPVGVMVRGANATVGGLKLRRDIYYRGKLDTNWSGGNLIDALHDPSEWFREYRMLPELYRELDISVPEHSYLAMGDNSPRSYDSRHWRRLEAVPREYLVGKAFWIYWPHGVPFLNDGRGFGVVDHKTVDIQGNRGVEDDYQRYAVPFYPDFTRMKRIR